MTLVSHSLGGLFGLFFLQRQPPAWKQKYCQGLLFAVLSAISLTECGQVYPEVPAAEHSVARGGGPAQHLRQVR